MNTIQINYDLRAPGRDYQPVYDYIKRHSSCHLLESCWLVRTNKTAKQVRDDVRGLIDRNDRVATFNVTGDAWATNWSDKRGRTGSSRTWACPRAWRHSPSTGREAGGHVLLSASDARNLQSRGEAKTGSLPGQPEQSGPPTALTGSSQYRPPSESSRLRDSVIEDELEGFNEVLLHLSPVAGELGRCCLEPDVLHRGFGLPPGSPGALPGRPRERARRARSVGEKPSVLDWAM